MHISLAVARYTSLVLAVLALSGCPLPEFPDAFDVAITGTEKHSAPRDTGPPTAANATWQAFRAPDPPKALPGPYGGLLNGGILERPPVDAQIFIADFGPNGAITMVHENEYLLPSVYGREIPIGGDWQGATVPFMHFRTACFGLEMDGRYGVAIVVHVRLANQYVGRAIIYSWGTIGEERIDGTFGYLLDFTGGLADILLNSGGDQYPFYAVPID
ncbi:MAG: hypothetical protein HYV26_21820 [Candidatus Hydrogenedentes bacterium]|nr:hypothetical protein [Candidatus Hydrogenedentota bacterium]MBI3117249.1 hypothetical protein [Candidatus Hydrogenedentota bacterium]